MYPEFYFSADDLKNPLKLLYKNYYYYFNINTQKIDRLFFNKISVKDDQGWIFEEIKESSLLSLSRIQSDLNFAEIKNGTISRFYEFNLYMEKKSMIIKRSFMKIQDVSAKVGGLIKIVMTLFAFFNSAFNIYSFKLEVFRELFLITQKGLEDAELRNKKTSK
jgi:hypothetical protein